MVNISYDSFLDMINLCIQPTFAKPLTRNVVIDVVKKLLVNLQEYIKVEPIFDTEENRYFMNIINELLTFEITLEDKNRLIVNSSKWLKNFPSSEDQTIKRILSQILLGEDAIDDKHLLVTYKKIKLTLMWCLSDKELRSIMYKMRKISNMSDTLTQEVMFKDIFEQAKNTLYEIKVIGDAVKENVNISSINMSDRESIKNALAVHRMTREDFTFLTGLQGLNAMLGGKGFTLGELVCFGGLSHHYKSGILMDCARWMVSYNTPPNFDDRIPVVLFISLENEATRNLINWYKRGYFMKHGEPPPDHFTDDDIADFISTTYSINGWELHIERKLGPFFAFEDYLSLLDEFKKKGRRVYISIIDYFLKMSLGKRLNLDSPAIKSAAVQDLFNNFLNHANHENVLTIGAQQLGPKAAEIAANTPMYPVKKFNPNSHFADSSNIIKEISTNIMLHKELNTNKQPFLTMNWGKRRDEDPPDPEHLFCAYPFTKYGIVDDINFATSQAVSDIYSYRASQPASEIEDLSIFN